MVSDSRYDQKRSFDATPEPPGTHGPVDVDPLSAPGGEVFVIQQHHATALHHDVRLEMLDDRAPVLVSWAVPKGLPRRRGERHLAIRTEDHPMEYAEFSGSIPEGEYGGGEVRIFDHGTYEIVDRTDERLTVSLRGDRLDGVWHLVHTGPMNGKDAWLAIMSADRRPPPQPWPPADPMVAEHGDQAFDDEAWGFEPGWNGIRLIARCTDETHLYTSAESEVTERYPELARLHDRVVALDAMLDGELVAFDDGRPSRELLEEREDEGASSGFEERAGIPIAYLVFDLLYLDGRDLTIEPLRERRRLLDHLIVTSEKVQLSPLTERDGTALSLAVAEQGLSAIVAKRLASPYRPGARTEDWLEIDSTS